jgi:pimeloyl-ACP methyl ester carboxylesterase
MTMRAFAADDGEWIHAAVSGHGPPVVMLHGWTSSHAAWHPFVASLSRGHALYRWDARGHGLHGLATATVPTVQRMARDLQNLLDHYRLDDAVLVGHSMGVLTIWEYVRTFGTGRTAALCLIDQSPKLMTDAGWHLGIYGDFDRDRSDRFLAELRQDFAEAVLRLAAFGNNATARQRYAEDTGGWRLAREALRRLDPAPLIAAWQSLVEADFRDALPAIDVPTLLVYGGESNFYGADTARYVHGQIPGSDLRIYEGADHSPHLMQRERFEQDLSALAAG